MAEEIITTLTTEDGKTQTYVLKEKINNGNGQLLYRFRHQERELEHLITRDGDTWRSLNPGDMHEHVSVISAHLPKNYRSLYEQT